MRSASSRLPPQPDGRPENLTKLMGGARERADWSVFRGSFVSEVQQSGEAGKLHLQEGRGEPDLFPAPRVRRAQGKGSPPDVIHKGRGEGEGAATLLPFPYGRDSCVPCW
ncbi:hypothetical protein E2C01_043382 [Portunus trituberculatus]|uniref:Uncharacterized protein n=1 Tax=Portunus trituberculatus TaxID=210409 RepID=A0A5B7FW85_PORTR|nr:hypothetical protein [Portunus trituberculatus]